MASDVGPLVPLDQNNNSSSGIKKMGKNYEKYSLRPRSIQKRIETEKRAKEPKKVPKAKSKAPPLSKYRRKTANARERSRMQEINSAFDSLQQIVPQYPVLPVNAQGKTCEKLTKITTLRLAMDYISSLNKLLNGGGGGGSSSSSTLFQNSISNPVSADEEPFSSSPSCSLGSSEFSPGSSSSGYMLSPLPQPPPPINALTTTPDCLQTVMRSVVLPPATRKTGNNFHSDFIFSSTSNTSSTFPSTDASSYFPSLLSSSSASLDPFALKIPTSVKLNQAIVQSMSSLLAKCSGGNRTGSLSSLTESDLSEYTSDLLSDEGSSLDDPMFDDIIGMDSGIDTVDDLDHLILEPSADRLHFSSEMGESFSHSLA